MNRKSIEFMLSTVELRKSNLKVPLMTTLFSNSPLIDAHPIQWEELERKKYGTLCEVCTVYGHKKELVIGLKLVSVGY